MEISKNKVVHIDYTLKDKEGSLIDTSKGHQPLAYIHGIGNLIPGLEKELEGKKVGDKIKAEISPADGYGKRDEQLIQKVPLEQFPESEKLKVGMQIQIHTNLGVGIGKIAGVSDKEISIDLNHPLADVELHFNVEIMSVREASEEEIQHGYVHGDGGHHH